MIKSITTAVIIAGGKGTRIVSVTGDQQPKAMLQVARVPNVYRQLRLLYRYGIRKVAFIAGHLAQKLEQGVKPEAQRLGMKVEFFIEKEPLGTAGGLHKAKSFLAGDDFLVIYGDVAVEMDLKRLIAFHFSKKALITIVAHPNDHPADSDLILIDHNERVDRILTKKQKKPEFYRNIVPAAVYCLSQAAIDLIIPQERQEFVEDIFPKALSRNLPVYAYITPEYLRDIGSPERLAMVERDINTGLFARMNIHHKRPAVFFDRDGVLNYDRQKHGILNVAELKLLDGATQAVNMVNKSGRLAVVVTNQPQLAKGFTSAQELVHIHAGLETLFGLNNAKFDGIFFCPHHPHGGFEGEIKSLKIDCFCRKPKPGMLLQAASQLPILLDDSCLIGDSWRDAGAARALGIPFYGVRTGMGCKECIGELIPDLMFDDVLEAVKFITIND